MTKKIVSHKKEIRTLYKSGISVVKLAKKFKLTESGVRWHLNN